MFGSHSDFQQFDCKYEVCCFNHRRMLISAVIIIFKNVFNLQFVNKVTREQEETDTFSFFEFDPETRRHKRDVF